MKFSQKNIENWRSYVLEQMGLNFYYCDGLQLKMSAGIINEHECINRTYT